MGIGIQTFNKTIATAGTRVQVTASTTYCQAVIFESHEANLGSIYVGGSAVSTASYVKKIAPGSSFSINAAPGARLGPDGGMVELSQFWLDAGTASQVVCVSYVMHIGRY